MMDFGCFIELDGFRGPDRTEGLVHISQLAARGQRVTHPKELVKRGQKVKVKIISMAGTKLSLSMREVDQATGEDLMPRLKPGEAKIADFMSSKDGPTSNPQVAPNLLVPACARAS
jgi:ATP-dependent RNA helicase DHX8/PRP22